MAKVNERPIAQRALSTLALYSTSRDPADYVREWTTDGRKIEPGDAEYSERCQICGCRGPEGSLQVNIIIENVLNGSRLAVGIDCAAHWTLMDGAADAVDNKRVIQDKIAQYQHRQQQLAFLPRVKTVIEKLLLCGWSPTPVLTPEFAAFSTVWVGESWERVHVITDVMSFLTDALGREPTASEGQLLRTHLQSGIASLRETGQRKIAPDEAVGHWANVIHVQAKTASRRVEKTLAKSEVYKNPSKQVE